MIIVKLRGGLGNQMFQYALGKCLADKNQTTLGLDISSYTQNSLRHYELDCFNIKGIIFSRFNLPLLNLRCKLKVFLTKRSDFFYHFDKKIYLEKMSFNFDPEVLRRGDNTYLYGYWQNELYFQDIEDLLRQDFRFVNKLDNKNKQIANKILSTNSIGLHIRRGDFTENKTKAHHGLLNLNYYQKAIKYIKTKIDKPHFFVFSDDLKWAKRNLILKHPTEYVEGNKGLNSYKDMQLMHLCKHNIIANSSFSWWGAWLNKHKNKLVVSPSQLSNKQMKINNLPNSWIKIT